MKKAAITVLALLLAAALAGCGEKPAVSPVAPAAATTATLTATSETSVSVESVAPTPAVTPSCGIFPTAKGCKTSHARFGNVAE